MKLRIRFQCTGCGACAAICLDGAIRRTGRRMVLDAALCHSCRDRSEPLCLTFCPAGAISVEGARTGFGRNSLKRKRAHE